MALPDILIPASFRGVPFEIDGTELTDGRRTQRNEFPQPDEVLPAGLSASFATDDLGAKVPEHRISGYVWGPGYLATGQRLRDAVRIPGPGVLIHPYLGLLTVVVEEFRVRQSSTEGGVLRFEMTVAEKGAEGIPTVTDVVSAIGTAAAAVQEATSFDLASVWDVVAAPGDLVLSAADKLRSTMSDLRQTLFGGAWRVLGQVSQVGAAIDSVLASALDLVLEPLELAERFEELFDLVGDGSAVGWEQALGVVEASEAATSTADTILDPAGASPVARAAARNGAALTTALRRAALRAAAQRLPSVAFAAAPEALEARDRVAGLLADEAAATTSDNAWIQLTTLRSQLVLGMTAAARPLAQLRVVELPEVRPALVVAHDLYRDATRGDEVVARNRVTHPGFLRGSLEVLDA